MVRMGSKRESTNPGRQILLLLLMLQMSAANAAPTSNVQGKKMHNSMTASSVGYSNRRQQGASTTTEDEVERVAAGSVMGSRPPICDHKCGGCVPCAAVQVPTNTNSLRADNKYANYEPERWKCKCESSFYNP